MNCSIGVPELVVDWDSGHGCGTGTATAAPFTHMLKELIDMSDAERIDALEQRVAKLEKAVAALTASLKPAAAVQPAKPDLKRR